ncbi:MAG: glycosyltransferase family 4 protein [Bacteroidales bacterium]|nr:glycosyltransferase family 4 protein [Bacteroidales bacterium]
MRILIAHNDYGRYSGEEAVVDRQIADYKAAGHDVATLRLTSEGARDSVFGKIRGFFAGIYSIRGRRTMRRCLADFRPDIVHIHNLYPFISPAVLPLCKKNGVPVVMTVHNYRLICPTGLFLRNGHPCETCLERGNETGCILHNCEQSLFRSIGYALRNTTARLSRAYLDNVDHYCCLTEFQRAKLIAAGFDKDRISVIPNYIELPEPTDKPFPQQGFVGYAGRLSYEKGFDLLMEVARRHPEIEFRFAGTLREEEKATTLPNVTLCGQLGQEQLAAFYTQARFIVIASRCYEGFPLALLEASSHSRCCIAPDHGAFPDLMRDGHSGEMTGLLFRPLDTDDLEDKVVRLWNDTALASRLGHQARQNCQARFTKETVTRKWNDTLMQIADTCNSARNRQDNTRHTSALR